MDPLDYYKGYFILENTEWVSASHPLNVLKIILIFFETIFLSSQQVKHVKLIQVMVMGYFFHPLSPYLGIRLSKMLYENRDCAWSYSQYFVFKGKKCNISQKGKNAIFHKREKMQYFIKSGRFNYDLYLWMMIRM